MEILSHLGADPGYWDAAYEREQVVRAEGNVLLGLRAHRLKAGSAGDVYRRVLPEGLRERIRSRVRRLLGGREVWPEPSAELRAWLGEGWRRRPLGFAA